MQFDAVGFLDDLLSGAQPEGTTMVPEGTAVVSAGEPDTDLAARFAGWGYRQDATGWWGWEAPDLPEWQRWWAHPENVIEPGESCPRCGSLEKWWDLAGGEHCQRCERDG